MARQVFTYNGTEYKLRDLKVENKINDFDFFSGKLVGPSSGVKSTVGRGGHLIGSHEVLITDRDGSQIFGGFLEAVDDDGLNLILKGRDYKVLLLDERTTRDLEYINQTGATIINGLLGYSTKVVAGTITYTETLSGTFRFNHDNLLKSIAEVCKQNGKDFWVWNDSGTLKLDVGSRGSGSSGSPVTTYEAGVEISITAEKRPTMEIVNRQRVFGSGDGINQIQVCVPWIDVNILDSERSQGFDGYNADCLHADATTSQGVYGVMEGRPYVDRGIVSTDIAITSAKAILDEYATDFKRLDVEFLKYIMGRGVGDWVTIIDRKKGINSAVRIKNIVRNYDKNLISLVFYDPAEEISSALAKVQRDSDLSNLNGIGATNLIEINFPDICDNSNPYEMWFELPSEVEFINRIKLTYIVDDYRAFTTVTSGGVAHSHTVPISAVKTSAQGGSAIGMLGVQTWSGSVNALVCNTNISDPPTSSDESAHTHDIDFSITKQADSLSDVAIWVDDGAGYVDKTATIEADIGHTLGLTSETDIPMQDYITATSGVKKIKIVPTGSNDGECRITGLCMVMFYMQSI